MFKKEKLKGFLEEKHMSQREFGELIGVSGSMVGYLTVGFKQPSAVLLCRIAEVMGCTMDELME